MLRKNLSIVAVCAVLLAGCSSRPRNFAPQLSAAPANETAYETVLQECRAQAAASVGKNAGRLGSAAGGAAIGAGTGVAAGAAAGSAASSAMFASAAAAAAAMVVVAPVAAIAGAWGISKIKKNKKERTIKAAMTECLAKSGYSVGSWRVMSRQEVRSLKQKSSAATSAGDAGSAAATDKSKPQP